MADLRVRQIKIKTGVVKRLVKEKMMYEKEAKQQEEKIEKMKAEDGENCAIKKQAEILQESRMMIPDCQRRLEAAHADLLQLLESEKDLEEAEEYKEARLVLDSVKLEVMALIPHTSHFNLQGPQQLSAIRLIDIKHYCKLHHQNRLALEHGTGTVKVAIIYQNASFQKS
ncbi:tubulin-specific chaperone A-like [Moschus berezovskii]|uniref:tubulin-specific chaperone A-like n=1 Tax=Moschus berezovskii TaxID=68408 RepID=UPI002443BD1C|nr:tubulin-specific chaperone A-like [Moschus berezovskii]